MDVPRRSALATLALGAATSAHGLLTWPADRALAVFVGGAAIVFAAEVLGQLWGLVEHELEPQVIGVPVMVIVGWPATVYIALRLALIAAPLGLAAAALAAGLATLADLVLDPLGVAVGAWRYPTAPVSAARYRGVPYWNFVAWLVISFLTAMLAAVPA